jgi:hypothetical protein
MGKMDDILGELGVNKKNSKGKIENNILTNITKIPKKEPKDVMPHTTASQKFASIQADLLFMPTDDGYKYILVAVDIASRICDAEPLKTKEADSVKKAMEKMFKRKIIKTPLRLEIDAGTEFQGNFEKHFKKIFQIIRKQAGRHRQQSVVESKNHQIGTILNKRMLAAEINNDETSREWVDILPNLVTLINQKFSIEVKQPDPTLPVKTDNYSKDVLPVGSRVRVMLDNPVDYVAGAKLNGRFRAGDIRWSKDTKVITRFYLRPNQPPMYEVGGDNRVAYTKYQLQIVKDDEKMPSIEGQKKAYAQEILSKRKAGGKLYYKVRFEDGDIVEQDRVQVMEEIPFLLKEFNDKVKKGLI